MTCLRDGRWAGRAEPRKKNNLGPRTGKKNMLGPDSENAAPRPSLTCLLLHNKIEHPPLLGDKLGLLQSCKFT